VKAGRFARAWRQEPRAVTDSLSLAAERKLAPSAEHRLSPQPLPRRASNFLEGFAPAQFPAEGDVDGLVRAEGEKERRAFVKFPKSRAGAVENRSLRPTVRVGSGAVLTEADRVRRQSGIVDLDAQGVQRAVGAAARMPRRVAGAKRGPSGRWAPDSSLCATAHHPSLGTAPPGPVIKSVGPNAHCLP